MATPIPHDPAFDHFPCFICGSQAKTLHPVFIDWPVCLRHARVTNSRRLESLAHEHQVQQHREQVWIEHRRMKGAQELI